jgi:hypothetical protein
LYNDGTAWRTDLSRFHSTQNVIEAGTDGPPNPPVYKSIMAEQASSDPQIQRSKDPIFSLHSLFL